MAGRPGHEELDHPLGLGRMVQPAVGRSRASHRGIGIGRKQAVGPQQGRKCHPAQAAAALPEEIAPVHGLSP